MRSYMQHKYNNAKIVLLAESSALPQALFLWNMTVIYFLNHAEHASTCVCVLGCRKIVFGCILLRCTAPILPRDHFRLVSAALSSL